MASPTNQQTFALAVQHHQAGRLHDAERLYRQILAQQPQRTEVVHNLGLIAHQVGQDDAALDLFRRAVALDPRYAEAHNSFGNALKAIGQLEEAVAAYRRAIALKPTLPVVYNNLAAALRELGRLDEAIAACRQAIAIAPQLPEAHNALGAILKDKGQLDEAIAAIRQAIALRPDYSIGQNNLGLALKEKRAFGEAITAFQRALAIDPHFAEAYNNLGSTLRSTGQLDEAIAMLQRAIYIDPNLGDAYANLGNALRDIGQLDESVAAFRQAVAVSPESLAADSSLVYSVCFNAASDAPTIAAELGRWNQLHAEPLARLIAAHTNEPDADRVLRVGYISPNFREHCQAMFMLPLLANHDRAHVAVYCYSDVSFPDALTKRHEALADTWRDCRGMSDEDLATLIREDRIDILVDLTLHMGSNHLLVFARKPAPVQATWLGYPGTTGLKTIDYRLSDPYLDPLGADESLYTERTIRLPDCFWCYDPLEGREIEVSALPAESSGVVTFGCLNSLFKITPRILMLWTQVLKRAPNSRLLILAPAGSARLRVLEKFQQEGIDLTRVEFVPRLPRLHYLQYYHRIDISLDTLPINGHTTSLDSFWMGVPVVTLIGQTPVARAGWCQLSNLGLPELAGQTDEDYVRIAVKLAGDLPRLAELRLMLRRQIELSPLMDALRFARNIEAAYRQMWRTWCETHSATKP